MQAMRSWSKLLILLLALLIAPATVRAAALPVPDRTLAEPAPALRQVRWPFGGLFGRRRHVRHHRHRRGMQAHRRRMHTNGGTVQDGGGAGSDEGKLRFH